MGSNRGMKSTTWASNRTTAWRTFRRQLNLWDHSHQRREKWVGGTAILPNFKSKSILIRGAEWTWQGRSYKIKESTIIFIHSFYLGQRPTPFWHFVAFWGRREEETARRKAPNRRPRKELLVGEILRQKEIGKAGSGQFKLVNLSW